VEPHYGLWFCENDNAGNLSTTCHGQGWIRVLMRTEVGAELIEATSIRLDLCRHRVRSGDGGMKAAKIAPAPLPVTFRRDAEQP